MSDYHKATVSLVGHLTTRHVVDFEIFLFDSCGEAGPGQIALTYTMTILHKPSTWTSINASSKIADPYYFVKFHVNLSSPN